jgi:hypothetical protein
MCVLLAAVITLMLGGAYVPGYTLFSNDGPLGRIASECHRLPGAFSGVWEDLNSVGYRESGALPNITYGLRLLLKPLGFSKFYAPVGLFVLGLGAWCFFRQSGLQPVACILGGLAAILNSDFFSNACWGVVSHTLTVGMTFLALAALLRVSSWRGWLRAALAGMAVGMGVAEGTDVGAIFSIYVAAFVCYQAAMADGPRLRNAAIGVGRLAVIVVFAGFIAAQAISVLVDTQIVGIAGTSQDEATREQRWNWATQWSLPKQELLGVIVPQLFGARTETMGEAAYWGALGRSPEWDAYLAGGRQGKAPITRLRQTGSGFYAGVPVVMIACWTMIQAFRRRNCPFSLSQRRWLWFWMGVIVFSLPMSLGRHAPFYRFLYSLPYFSTIRNPVKFLDLVSLALVILFAYGVDGFWRMYVAPSGAVLNRSWPGVRRWWPTAGIFEKRWVRCCLALLGVAVFAWIAYASSRQSLERYLETVNFSEQLASLIAGHSIRQVGWFVMSLALSTGVVVLFFSGAFAGQRAGWGAIVLGLLVVADLGRANMVWVEIWNYGEKYASNPLVDFLSDRPYEHRVAIAPFRGPPKYDELSRIYRVEWSQQQFQYYDIQSLDIVQLSRMPEDLKTFNDTFRYDGTDPSKFHLSRRWALTNTRYIFGTPELVDVLNNQGDPVLRRFHSVLSFDIVPKPGTPISLTPHPDSFTAVLNNNGAFSIIQFDGALPRASLFANWQVETNRQAALNLLATPDFDPQQRVVVSDAVPPAAPVGTNSNAGSVQIESYASKDVVLNANPLVPAILLLNDRFDPNWKVLVDGKPAGVLRCNYLMRGVYLEPGAHRVEFRFQPPFGLFYVSVAGVGVAVVLLVLVLFVEYRHPLPVQPSEPVAAPVAAKPIQTQAVRNGDTPKAAGPPLAPKGSKNRAGRSPARKGR